MAIRQGTFFGSAVQDPGWVMFGFFFRKKQDEVRRVLAAEMNRGFMRDFQFGKRRESRGYLFEVVWVVPCGETGSTAEFESVFPAVTKDASPEGLSLIHRAPISTTRVLVGIGREPGRQFLLCEVGHSTPLGYGFWQVGLHPVERLHIDARFIEQMEERLDQFADGTEPQLEAEAVAASAIG